MILFVTRLDLSITVFLLKKTYVFWIKHYIFFHQKRHPMDLGKKEIEDFLT
ncbi:MAG: phage integrase N-terminal SAM-like domain-containing protein, partial [Epsilonproteobacteria bacterium]|nr:phage integrase N-terminal SAM-like domain-containing protein [Campylobacterota bacterium]